MSLRPPKSGLPAKTPTNVKISRIRVVTRTPVVPAEGAMLPPPRPPPKRPSSARTPSSRPSSSSSARRVTSTPSAPKPKKEFELPPLSILTKATPKAQSEIDKLKKKTIRRNKPEGEDPKKIREIIKEIKNQDVTVHEFVGMVSPYTGDNGAVLRQVLADDLATFRNMVRRVYETMTQDVSDVLTNEQLQLTDFYKERREQLMNRMMKAINEIFFLAPDFDFERYYRESNYLRSLFPLPQQEEEPADAEEAEMQKRQEAYHRLQWLRMEGERLMDENSHLQNRLRELKQMQRQEVQASAAREQEAEMRRAELEAVQAEELTRLDELNESLENTIVQHERAVVRKASKQAVSGLRSRTSASGTKKSKSKSSLKGRTSGSWNAKTAAKIEEAAVEENLQSETSRISTRSSTSRSSIASAKKRSKGRAGGGFHYSPIKTPPKAPAQPRQLSPFHYSPPRTPPEVRQARVQQQQQQQQQPQPSAESTRIDAAPQRQAPPRMGRTQAPRDSWGGF